MVGHDGVVGHEDNHCIGGVLLFPCQGHHLFQSSFLCYRDSKGGEPSLNERVLQ